MDFGFLKCESIHIQTIENVGNSFYVVLKFLCINHLPIKRKPDGSDSQLIIMETSNALFIIFRKKN